MTACVFDGVRIRGKRDVGLNVGETRWNRGKTWLNVSAAAAVALSSSIALVWRVEVCSCHHNPPYRDRGIEDRRGGGRHCNSDGDGDTGHDRETGSGTETGTHKEISGVQLESVS
jgi:hypothetical protein